MELATPEIQGHMLVYAKRLTRDEAKTARLIAPPVIGRNVDRGSLGRCVHKYRLLRLLLTYRKLRRNSRKVGPFSLGVGAWGEAKSRKFACAHGE